MASHPTLGNGKICYIEIPAIDINISSKFYEQVFNWNIRVRDDGSTSFDDGVGEVSGAWVLNRKAADQIGFMISIMVINIRKTIQLITDNGGQILSCDLDGRDRLASFSDPAGNILGLYEHVAS